jgi:D-lactate dehydrogenase
MKIAFFETTAEDQAYLKEKLADQNWTLLFFDAPFSPNLLKDNQEIEALSVFVGSKITPENLKEFKQLKLITTRSTGFDHLDLRLADQGIKLGYVPGYGDNTVAEFAVGLMLSVIRKIALAYYRLRVSGEFKAQGCEGFDLWGKTLAVVGTGRIGKHMVRLGRGLGMKVIAYDPHPDNNFSQEAGFEYLALPQVLAQSDVVSLHVPYMPETHHLIDDKALALMKPGAILINTARGGVIDTHALLMSLQTGQLGGFGADVLEGEENITDERSFLLYGQHTKENVQTLAENLVLVDLPNVVLTPHIAFYTQEALRRILETDMANLKSFFKTGQLVYDVTSSRRVAGLSSPQGDKKE